MAKRKNRTAGATAPADTAQTAENTVVASQDENQLTAVPAPAENAAEAPATQAEPEVQAEQTQGEAAPEAPASEGQEPETSEQDEAQKSESSEQGEAQEVVEPDVSTEEAETSQAAPEFPGRYTITNRSRMELVLPVVDAIVPRFGGSAEVVIRSNEHLQALTSELETLKELNDLPTDAFVVTATR